MEKVKRNDMTPKDLISFNYVQASQKQKQIGTEKSKWCLFLRWHFWAKKHTIGKMFPQN